MTSSISEQDVVTALRAYGHERLACAVLVAGRGRPGDHDTLDRRWQPRLAGAGLRRGRDGAYRDVQGGRVDDGPAVAVRRCPGVEFGRGIVVRVPQRGYRGREPAAVGDPELPGQLDGIRRAAGRRGEADVDRPPGQPPSMATAQAVAASTVPGPGRSPASSGMLCIRSMARPSSPACMVTVTGRRPFVDSTRP